MAPTHALALIRSSRLLKCQYGATIAEYAIGAAMVATAVGAADISKIEFPATSFTASDACTYVARGTTPRWERPAPRCTTKHFAG